jgi:inosine-uridine nucleoside N-ribohydrolase
MSRRRIWIDTDPAVTSGNGEVDDVFALVQALRSPELDIVGISATHGNASRDHGLGMAQEVVRLTGRGDVPVYGGCASADDRSDNQATFALRAALAQGPLAIAALGPITTVATALMHPDAARENVEDLVFVGGRRRCLEFLAVPHQPKPFRDFNFESDVAATETLLDLGVPLTLAGWECASTLWLTPAHLDGLRDSGDAPAAWLSDSARGWIRRWTEELGAPGFTPFDTLAIGWLLHPALMTVEVMPVAIEHDGDRPLLIADAASSGPEARYVRTVDADAMRRDLLARLSGRITPASSP